MVNETWHTIMPPVEHKSQRKHVAWSSAARSLRSRLFFLHLLCFVSFRCCCRPVKWLLFCANVSFSLRHHNSNAKPNGRLANMPALLDDDTFVCVDVCGSFQDYLRHRNNSNERIAPKMASNNNDRSITKHKRIFDISQRYCMTWLRCLNDAAEWLRRGGLCGSSPRPPPSDIFCGCDSSEGSSAIINLVSSRHPSRQHQSSAPSQSNYSLNAPPLWQQYMNEWFK